MTHSNEMATKLEKQATLHGSVLAQLLHFVTIWPQPCVPSNPCNGARGLFFDVLFQNVPKLGQKLHV